MSDWARYRQQVMDSARGRYRHILQELGIAPDFLRDRGGPCPGCGGTDRMRFDDKNGTGSFYCSQGGGDPAAGDGIELLRHVFGWGFTEAVDRVADVLGVVRPGEDAPSMHQKMHQWDLPPPAPLPAVDERKAEKARAALRAVWKEALPVDWATDNPVTRYLQARGLGAVLNDPPQGLRLHPGLKYWRGRDVLGVFPALLAPIAAPDGRPVVLHRTYLAGDGRKADVPSPKKVMACPEPGATRGGAVRLYPAGERLDVAEGIETALAIRVALGVPVWACVSDGGMRRLVVPSEVQHVGVWADHDAKGAGQQAGAKLVQRMRDEGRKADLYLPAAKGADWLDVLLADKGR